MKWVLLGVAVVLAGCASAEKAGEGYRGYVPIRILTGKAVREGQQLKLANETCRATGRSPVITAERASYNVLVCATIPMWIPGCRGVSFDFVCRDPQADLKAEAK